MQLVNITQAPVTTIAFFSPFELFITMVVLESEIYKSQQKV